MNNFVNKLAISGTRGELAKLAKKLEKLGYVFSTNSIMTNNRGEDFLCTFNPQEEKYQLMYNYNGNSRYIQTQGYGFQELSVEDEDLILALAAMKDGEDPNIGELFVMEAAGGYSFAPDNNGCLAKVTEVGTYRYTGKVSFAGTLINPKVDRCVEFSSIPLKDDNRTICRKATKEEVMEYYKNTPIAIGYTCPTELYGGEVAAGTLYKPCFNTSYYEPETTKSGGATDCVIMPKEIVEAWEPVYKKPKPTLNIAGYEAKVEDGALAFGCVKLTPARLEAIKYLVSDSEAMAELKIRDVVITPEVIETATKILNDE